jgi:hypothetical protein
MEMMTIAQRKAAKLNKLQNSETAPVSTQSVSIQNMTVNEASRLLAGEGKVESQVIETKSITPSAAPVSAAQPNLSAAEILELAAKHGLVLQAPKKEFTKHTYSVTVDSKNLFKKYCDVLGMSMQDAMEESMQDFFKKHALEYSRIKSVKNG